MRGLRVKLVTAFAVLLLLLVAVSVLANAVLAHSTSATERMLREDLESIGAVRTMRGAMLDLKDAVQALRDGDPVTDLKPLIAAFEEALLLESNRSGLPQEPAAVGRIADRWAKLKPALVAVRVAPVAEREAIAEREIDPAFADIDDQLNLIFFANFNYIRSSQESLHEITAMARYAMYGLTITGVAIAGAFVLLVGRVLLRPLSEITELAHAVQAGDLDRAAPVRTSDELGTLARAFNDMAAQLRVLRQLDHERLLRSRRTTQNAIDHLPDAVAVLDPDGRIELVNETAARLFALRAGARIDELPDAAHLAEVHRRALAQSQPAQITGYGTSIRVMDERLERYFLPQARAIVDDAGRVVGVTLVLADVTDYRRLDELKDDLLSMTSHELKTPLTSLRMALPLVLEGQLGPLTEAQGELLAAANQDAERLHGIVENLLDLGRLASGRVPMRLESADPHAIAESAVERHRDAYAEANVELRNDVLPLTPTVRADARHIRHALDNLLANALRYTPSGGTVSVSARAAGDAVEFAVSDTGVGIAPEHLQRLFERFFRVPGQDNSTGTGLGLAIVKQIVHAHGGQVGVESRVGSGTTFRFTLGRAADEVLAVAPHAA